MPSHTDYTNRRNAYCAWLTANHINPADILRDADVYLDTAPDGGQVIVYEGCVLDSDGRRQLDERLNRPATERRTAPLLVDPPTWWEPYRKPTRDQLLEGEQPYTDPQTVPTPSQWVWLWNRLTPAERLERAQLVLDDRESASRCISMNHQAQITHLEAQLAEGARLTERWRLQQDRSSEPYAFVPPAGRELPKNALDSATSGASMLDAYALTPNGRNLLAHALAQLARDGWLRTEPEPAQAFDPNDHPRPAAAPREAP